MVPKKIHEFVIFYYIKEHFPKRKVKDNDINIYQYLLIKKGVLNLIFTLAVNSLLMRETYNYLDSLCVNKVVIQSWFCIKYSYLRNSDCVIKDTYI